MPTLCHSIYILILQLVGIKRLQPIAWHGDPSRSLVEVEGQGKKNNGYFFLVLL
jgi:hypothetical protein